MPRAIYFSYVFLQVLISKVTSPALKKASLNLMYRQVNPEKP